MLTQKVKAQRIDSVVKQGLCTGCGTCVAMCPANAITICINQKLGIYLPEISTSKCNNCSICYKVCPGWGVNFKELSKTINSQETTKPHRELLGNYLNCYAGYSTNLDIRFNSSSGGIVTQLLLFALEEGIIDGVLVTRMSKERPLEPEPFIARTRQEIIDASKSKYCPVPANIAFKEILKLEGKYAVVGLPCHIHGLKKAQALNKKLNERVVFSIAIFCSHSDNFFQTHHILNRLNVHPKDIQQLDYRGNGWPGKLDVSLKTGGQKEILYSEYIRLHEFGFFTPDRCLVCCDHVGELADFSCGDAWLPEFSKDSFGTSLIIYRNDQSEEILKEAILKNKLNLNKISAKKVVKSQGNVRFKKNSFVVRSFLFRLFGKAVPHYVILLPKAQSIDWVRSIAIFLNRWLASKPFFNRNVDVLVRSQRKFKKIYLSAISK